MKRSLLMFACLSLVVCTNIVCADGGLVRLDTTVGGYRIVALTSPTPLLEGELDLTVLLSDADTSKPVTDIQVEVAIVPASSEAPSEDAWGDVESGRAGHPGGVGAFFEVWPGEWVIFLRVTGPRGGGSTEFPLVVGKRSRWLDIWPWLLPLFAMGGLWLLREWARTDPPNRENKLNDA